jgi:ferredoxin/flavodoxin---NADP+ reductase
MQTYKIAIVGAGPAGYFSAQALQNSQDENRVFAIDLFERLPTPWGLVRSGVAPDHPKIKTVAKVFEKIAGDPNFRLFGNIELGRDISIEQLKENYDAVILATGSPVGRKLGIPGEDLAGSLSASDFVPWYNGHPDYINVTVPLNGKNAIVIGAGNVAIDCGRMLALDPAELDSTDTADHALSELHQSSIRNVTIVGRRGPEHVAFTSPEIRELSKLENTDVIISTPEIEKAKTRVAEELEENKELRNNLGALLEVSQSKTKNHQRKLAIKFLLTPVEILGKDKVEAIRLARNEVVNGKVSATSEIIEMPCDLVITAIGYQVSPIPGVETANGKVLNENGLVADNLYVVGWAKRGPSGVIGTNKSDSSEVIRLLIGNLPTASKENPNIFKIFTSHQVITQSGWQKINNAEVEQGQAAGKPRRKVTAWKELLSLGR